MNCEKIYPLQQKSIQKIVDSLKDNNNIKKIIIFGSSVTTKCHINSDIDIYLELKENKKINFPFVERAYDYWNNFTVNDLLMKEIQDKGVIVYES